MRWLARILVLVALLYAGAVAALWAAQEALIFPGWGGPTAEQVASVEGLREIVIPGEIPLRAWSRPADPGQPTIVVFHGNAGTQWSQLPPFAERGWGILLPAYRGFAGNAGHPHEAGLYADAEATMAQAAAMGLTPGEIVLYGESLGTGVATWIAARPEGWRALVLDAPYTSVADRAAESYPFVPVRALIRHEFDTAGRIGAVEAPILILHGTADGVIPISHGRALARLVPDARAVWIEGGTHLLPPGRVAEEMADFLDR
ncbi:alpha/beta hydrolase [Jannaschia formosa]|uniref:alpha/beta hydrolase n=1 Tax=Jannaschia formosa TaxID=2259592 RepID=UPI000E1C0C6F|nr:alpha/beta hydrolase [Jannaschia formosa]TFL18741.1 alpha/beta hydrolase [Jannaschia formosa]